MGSRKRRGKKAEDVCPICKVVVGEDVESMCCEGMCSKWYHCSCIKMSSKDYASIMKLGDQVMWMCDYDKEATSRYGEITKSGYTMNSKLDKIIDEMNLLKEKVLKLEKNDENIIQNVMENENILVNEIKKVNMSKTETYASKLKNEPTIMVKPKQKQENKVTMDAIKELIDPVELKIVNVENRSNGSVAVVSKDKDSKKVKEAIVDKMGEQYSIEINELRKPRLFVHGLNEKLSERELVSKVKEQNDHCRNAEINCVKVLRAKNGKCYNAIIEVESDTFHKILERPKLNIGWDRCMVYDDVGVKRCYKCLGFNHMAKQCNNKTVCVNCKGEHESKKCERDKVETCTNCVNYNSRLKLQLETNHDVMSRECPVYIRKLEYNKRKIDY